MASKNVRLLSHMLQGLVHPIAAAAMGMLWNAGRVVYTLGETV